MPFVDTNSHLATKQSYFDIKCHSNSESYDRHVFLGPSLGEVSIVIYGWRFSQREADFPDLLISYVAQVMGIINVNVTAVLLGEWIFTESAHWADLVSKSRCLSVCNLSTPVT